MVKRSFEEVAISLIRLGSPKVFVLCILLLLWNESIDFDKDIDLAELFSGSGTLSKEFYYEGKEVVACDLKYGRGMDICQSSGFGTFCSAVLCGRPNSCVWLGVLCSSWVSISRPSTRRSYANPEGFEGYEKVRTANLMAARSAFLCLLAAALGQWWVIEQPRTSLLLQSQRFKWLRDKLQVYRLDLWMALFGSRTPKRSSLWSNSRVISLFFSSRKLQRSLQDPTFKTTKRYVNEKGKQCFEGNRNLTDTGIYTRQFARRAFEVMQLGESVLPKSEFFVGDKKPNQAILLFQAMDDSDNCEDAGLIAVAHYLRGCKALCIPEEWRAVLPKRL
ncbi:unnamed protein product [Symbiodinium sp. CCMP2592]|nr:unnamed protein product [Symbiodinium sp. CCMP2592]